MDPLGECDQGTVKQRTQQSGREKLNLHSVEFTEEIDTDGSGWDDDVIKDVERIKREERA